VRGVEGSGLAKFAALSHHVTGGPRKVTRYFSISWGPNQELNWALFEYKLEILAYDPTCPVTVKTREMECIWRIRNSCCASDRVVESVGHLST
jgi:hypothetical protein